MENSDKATGGTDLPTESPLKTEQQETEDSGQIEDHAEGGEEIQPPVEEMQTVEPTVNEGKEVKPEMELDAIAHEHGGKVDESKPNENIEEHKELDTLMETEEMVVKPKIKLTAKLEDLTDVESPDAGVSQYAIKFIENLKTHEVSDGKMLVSQMHGLMFEGSHHLRIPFQNVRWIGENRFHSLKREILSCIILSYEIESSGISYIFFTSEEFTDTDLSRMRDMHISESSTSASLDKTDCIKIQNLLLGQPLETCFAQLSAVPKGEFYSTEKFPRKLMVMVMDLECMTFFDGSTRDPPYQLIFWTEEGKNVVEAVKLLHANKEIHLETEMFLIVISDTGTIANRLKEMKPKEKHLFTDFQNLLKYAKQTIGEPLQLPGPVPSTSREEAMVFDADFQNLLKYAKQTVGEPLQLPGPVPSTSREEAMVFDAASGPYLELNIKREMEDAVLSIADTEEFKYQWITIAADLEEIEMTGAIQESEIQSGGLDPDNEVHLERALIDVSDQLRENKLDMALSRIQAARKLFTTSGRAEIRQIFDCSDQELLKKLYFRSIVS